MVQRHTLSKSRLRFKPVIMSARGEYGKRFYSASYLQVSVQIIIAMQHNYYMFAQKKGRMRFANEDHHEPTQVGEA